MSTKDLDLVEKPLLSVRGDDTTVVAGKTI